MEAKLDLILEKLSGLETKQSQLEKSFKDLTVPSTPVFKTYQGGEQDKCLSLARYKK